MLEELLQQDKTLFLYLNGLGSDSWDAFWLFVTNKWTGSAPVYALLLILSYIKFGLKKTLLIVLSVGVLIGVTDQLANFFKYGVGRFRPCHDEEINSLMRLVKSSCGGKYGYFSAHAANSFALAVFFINVLKKHIRFIWILLLVWAVLVAYSRIYVGVHFPLDVVTGMLIGSILGWIFYSLMGKLEARVLKTNG